MAVFPSSGNIGWTGMPSQDATTERFITRVSRELNLMRSRTVGRCVGCGAYVNAEADFMRVGSGVSHVHCAERDSATA